MWWTGWGVVAFVIVFLPMAIGESAWGQAGAVTGLVVGGVLLWFIGRYMNRDVLYLHVDGNEYLPRNRHTLYSIPIQYWSGPVFLWVAGSLIFGIDAFPVG